MPSSELIRNVFQNLIVTAFYPKLEIVVGIKGAYLL